MSTYNYYRKDGCFTGEFFPDLSDKCINNIYVRLVHFFCLAEISLFNRHPYLVVDHIGLDKV